MKKKLVCMMLILSGAVSTSIYATSSYGYAAESVKLAEGGYDQLIEENNRLIQQVAPKEEIQEAKNKDLEKPESEKVENQDHPIKASENQDNLLEEEKKQDNQNEAVEKIAPPNNEAPVLFALKSKVITEGQMPQITLSDLAQKSAEKEWRIQFEDQLIEKENVNTPFEEKPAKGKYKIALRIKEQKEEWSSWYETELTIKENKSPIIKRFKPVKNTYAQGENIKFTYSYQNESWENITHEYWNYRKSNQNPSEAVIGRPTAFFEPGDYVVTLQIEDENGHQSKKVQSKVHISKQVVQSEMQYHFSRENIGEVIDNFTNNNFREYRDALITDKQSEKGQLIMSDSPETLTRPGILYEDTFQGKGRLLVHHINRMSPNARTFHFVIWAINEERTPVHFKLKNKAIEKPQPSITDAGQQALYTYLEGSHQEEYTIPAGGMQPIYDEVWNYKDCVSGLMDIEVQGKVKIVIGTVEENTSYRQLKHLERLASDGKHTSGTFETLSLSYAVNLEQGTSSKIVIGEKGSEDWVKGIDVRTNAETENKGNFGVLYRITITAKEDTGVFLNSRGSKIKGAIKWSDEAVYHVPFEGILSQSTRRAAVIGILKKGETKTLEYMLPNGSSAPVLIGFIPRGRW